MPGYCAFADDTCDSGYRFHDRGTPEDLAGVCTEPLPEATTSTTNATGLGAVTDGSTSTVTAGESTSTSSDASGGPTDCGDRPCACAVAIGSGADHVCAVRLDGRVVCWGLHNFGQLGVSRPFLTIPWPQVVELPQDVHPVELVTGNHHTCGRTRDGDSWCWGRNASHEIDVDSRDETLLPMQIPARGPHGTMGVAPQHTCFSAAEDASVSCQGGAAWGELGAPPPGPGPFTTTLPGAARIDDLAVGRDHSCARVGPDVWCWGRNTDGQLGAITEDTSSPEPVQVMLPSAASRLVAGRDHTCAVLDDGISVSCWGVNVVGQIGDGTTDTAAVPTAPARPLPAPVVHASARLDSTCMLLNDGDIWCWGGLNGDYLGAAIEPDTPLLVPTRIDVVDEITPPLVEIILGNQHLCARAGTMQMWCWGSDAFEQLGPIDPPPGMHAVEFDLECPPGFGS
ncbi:MAG: hypothetical protein K0V04_18995 [Deltaproteobacteria bacterium]|nr:hypothetical protein [Deltaproteobacteria bacterium]